MFDSLFDNDIFGHNDISGITHNDLMDHITDPVYSYLPENIYHDTPMDPLYQHDDFGIHDIGNEAVICGLTPEKACNFKEFAA